MISAPASASATAIARPMPRLAPVTRAAFPSSRKASRITLQDRRARLQRFLTNLEAAAAGGQDLAGVQPRIGVEEELQAADRLERLVAEQLGHQLIFLHADAVLAGDGAARLNAVGENLFAAGARLFEVARYARVEQDDGMHVAVAGMEDVADDQPVLLR